MNLASLLGGGGLQTQMHPLAGVLGGSSSGLLGVNSVPNELAGLCALLGNQQSHNVTLTNLQVVELQRAVAAQKLATEKQAAALVQTKIAEKVAEETKKVAPGYLHVQPGAVPPEKTKQMGTATWCHLDLAPRRVCGGGLNMQSAQANWLPTRKRTKSSMALQVDSTGPVDIQVKTTRVGRDRHAVVFELQYEGRETGLNHATSWFKTLWKDSRPHETRRITMYPPIKGGAQRQENL